MNGILSLFYYLSRAIAIVLSSTGSFEILLHPIAAQANSCFILLLASGKQSEQQKTMPAMALSNLITYISTLLSGVVVLQKKQEYIT